MGTAVCSPNRAPKASSSPVHVASNLTLVRTHGGCSFSHCCAFPADAPSVYPPATHTAKECKRFVREHCREGSNPDYPWMQQIFTTLVTWRQLEQYLFPRLRTIWKTTPFRKAAPLDPDRNVFLQKVRLDYTE